MTVEQLISVMIVWHNMIVRQLISVIIVLAQYDSGAAHICGICRCIAQGFVYILSLFCETQWMDHEHSGWYQLTQSICFYNPTSASTLYDAAGNNGLLCVQEWTKAYKYTEHTLMLMMYT